MFIPAIPTGTFPSFFCPYGEWAPGTNHCEIGDHEVFDADQIDDGAEAFAGRIIHSGYDVIALNEVFDGSAGDILRDLLLPFYPNMVSYADEWGGTDQNSGITIYSKFPFMQINTHLSISPDYGDFDALVYRNGALEEEVDRPRYFAFKPFLDTCGSGDCWANKGIGYVRVRNPESRRFHNIFFTHLQATYLEEAKDETGPWQGLDYREQQFAMFEAMFNVAATTDPFQINATREDVFFMGDLNVEGDQSNTNNDLSATASPWNNKGEFTKYFNSNQWSGGLLRNTFHDIWSNQQVLRDTINTGDHDDFGITHGDTDCLSTSDGSESGNSVPGCRWDYILHNLPQQSSKLCNQHSTLALNLQYGAPYVRTGNHAGGRGNLSDGLMGTTDSSVFYSDHIGVNANYNRLFEQCSPLLEKSALAVYGAAPGGKSFGARTLTPVEMGNNTDGTVNFTHPGSMLTGTINNPGSVQWWRITQPGTYLIGFWDDQDPSNADTSAELGYQVDVFQSGNLSVPIKDYKGEEWTTNVRSESGGSMAATGFKYVLTDPPYYIKIYHPVQQHKMIAGNATGVYKFAAHRLNCTNKTAESCPIYPNMKISNYAFPANIAVQSTPTQDSLYFDLHVQQLSIPDTQTLKFVVSGYNRDKLQSMLTNDDPTQDLPWCAPGDCKENTGFNHRAVQNGFTTGSTGFNMTCPIGHGPLGDVNFQRCNNVITWEFPQPAQTTAELLWRVKRSSLSPAMTFEVTWMTNLSVLYGNMTGNGAVEVECVTETSDGSPSDEINMRVSVDGYDYFAGSPNGFVVADTIDEGGIRQIDGQLAAHTGLPIKYKSDVSFTLIEYDPNDPNEESEGHRPPLEMQSLGPNSGEVRTPEDHSWSDGVYQIRYNQSHGTQAFEPANL
jgi:hypothetical protein